MGSLVSRAAGSTRAVSLQPGRSIAGEGTSRDSSATAPQRAEMRRRQLLPLPGDRATAGADDVYAALGSVGTGWVGPRSWTWAASGAASILVLLRRRSSHTPV